MVLIHVVKCPHKSLKLCHTIHARASQASLANPDPPKQTSIKHSCEGKKELSFFLHRSSARFSVSEGQSLTSGRFETTTGVLCPNKRAPGSTPVFPMRARICKRSSSPWFPL